MPLTLSATISYIDYLSELLTQQQLRYSKLLAYYVRSKDIRRRQQSEIARLKRRLKLAEDACFGIQSTGQRAVYVEKDDTK